jgi:hypothetical protein
VVLRRRQFDSAARVDRAVRLVGQEPLPMLVLLGYTAAVAVEATAVAAMVVPVASVLFVLFGDQIDHFHQQIQRIYKNGSTNSN